VDIQLLVDKVAKRLPAWKGKFLNRAGRLTVLNMVLSSIPTYFLTAFQPQKWMIKQIDKLRRGFLWKGTEQANGGHCLVQWKKVQRPKKLGGLGVLDHERFSRALRLRWLWFEWNDADRPWVGGNIPVTETDRQVFRASTTVTVGNGRTAKFWEATWLNGQAPRDIAPRLYKLAWRKHLTVQEQMENMKWTRGLWRMTSEEEMIEFVVLWDLVESVELTPEDDKIIWKWTSHGDYTAKSAYEIQFRGSFCSFRPTAIWRAHAEEKHRFFAWLLVQEKLLTADKLMARNWSCNPTCSLCSAQPECAQHLCLHCPFAMQVWELVREWTNAKINVPVQDASIQDWWCDTLACHSVKEQRHVAAILMYTAWNIWKERNRRIFEGKSAEPRVVLQLIKEEVLLRVRACGAPVAS